MKYNPDEHNGRPATPESGTPETDAAWDTQSYNKLLDCARSLERRLAQAQASVAEIEKDAARYRWLQDWYLREGKRSEIDEVGHIRQTTALIMDTSIDAALKDRA